MVTQNPCLKHSTPMLDVRLPETVSGGENVELGDDGAPAVVLEPPVLFDLNKYYLYGMLGITSSS